MYVFLEAGMEAVMEISGVAWLQEMQRNAGQLGGKDTGFEIPKSGDFPSHL